MLETLSTNDGQGALVVLQTLTETDIQNKSLTQIELVDLILTALEVITTDRQQDLKAIKDIFLLPSKKTLPRLISTLEETVSKLSGGLLYQWAQQLGAPVGSRLNQALKVTFLPLIKKLNDWYINNPFTLNDLQPLYDSWDQHKKKHDLLLQRYTTLEGTVDDLFISNHTLLDINQEKKNFDDQLDYHAYLLKTQIITMEQLIKQLNTKIQAFERSQDSPAQETNSSVSDIQTPANFLLFSITEQSLITIPPSRSDHDEQLIENIKTQLQDKQSIAHFKTQLGLLHV